MAAQLQCYQLGPARPSSTPQHSASHRQAPSPPAALPKRAQPLTAWGCRSSASPRWRQPSSPSLAELRTVARAEGDENPLLLRWKERALGEPGFGQGNDEDSCDDPDPLDPESWEEGAETEWRAFLQASQMSQCKWWDVSNVDAGFPPTHVDLDKD